MLKKIATTLFGTRHEREMRRVQPIVDAINEEYERLHSVSEEELRGQTAKLRAIIAERARPLEAQIAALKERKHAAPDAEERERIDARSAAPTARRARGGAARDHRRDARRDPSRSVRDGARGARAGSSGRTAMVTGHETPWNMVHYDVQLMGGIQLHFGKIAEMATGEGKTLVATLPLYLNALPGSGAHLVTVNSYLARRDSQWMGHLYKYLGLTVGCLDDTEPGTPRAPRRVPLRHHVRHEQRVRLRLPARQHGRRRSTSACSARTRTRSSTKWTPCSSTKRGRRSSSRARSATRATRSIASTTPQSRASCARRRRSPTRSSAEGERALASGDTETAALRLYKAQLGAPEEQAPAQGAAGAGRQAARAEDGARAHRRPQAAGGEAAVPRHRGATSSSCSTRSGHTVHLTDRGVDFMSPDDHDAFVLPDISRGSAPHRSRRTTRAAGEARARAAIEREYASEGERLNIVHQLLRAHALYERDVNYVVQEGEVLIVDEFTGRTMPGRRWSEGLHQAVEAKEGVQREGRDADHGHDHDSELLPHVREARRHDGNGRDGGDGVPPDLQARCRGDSHEQARHPRRPPGSRLSRRAARSTTRSLEETQRLHDARLSGARRNGERRRVGDAREACSSAPASSTTCSTRSTTSARPRSSRRRGSPAR